MWITKKNRERVPKELNEIAYISMIRSILEHANVVWGPHLIKDTNMYTGMERSSRQDKQKNK